MFIHFNNSAFRMLVFFLWQNRVFAHVHEIMLNYYFFLIKKYLKCFFIGCSTIFNTRLPGYVDGELYTDIIIYRSIHTHTYITIYVCLYILIQLYILLLADWECPGSYMYDSLTTTSNRMKRLLQNFEKIFKKCFLWTT